MRTFNNMQRTLDITQCPDRFLNHNLAHGFYDMFALITRVQSHNFLYFIWTRLKWLEITHFVFVWKTSNNTRGRPNLRINMNQVTNLESLDFTWKKIASLLGVSTIFLTPYFCNRPFCGRRCSKTSICISCCSR